jgi:hypothetical protein
MRFLIVSFGFGFVLLPVMHAGQILTPTPVPSPVPSLSPLPMPQAPIDTQQLSVLLRNMLLPHIPKPLHESKHNWGHTAMVMHSVKWERKGVLLKPIVEKTPKNDGLWRHVNVEAVNPEKSLTIVVRNIQVPQEGRMTFDLVVGMDVQIEYEHQRWERGVRLLGAATKARAKIAVVLHCESISRTEPTGKFLPDIVFRLRVTSAQFHYYELDVEKVFGIGGDIGEALGHGLVDLLKTLKPSLERDLQEKANAAIVKAGDSKEVRISLSKLLEGKSPTSKKK